ncbi:MAG: class I SAM-dependent methyltransferase [Acidimicrobiales bacterium]
MDIDFGRTADDYATHRAGFPEGLFDRLDGLGIGLAGQRVLDLGTGTGTLARGLARRGCQVTGLDPSESLLDQARRLDAAAGVTVEYRIGRAEKTGLPAAAFEVVTAGQCWHWFDGAAAAAECARLLVDRGSVALCYFDWLPLPGSFLAATEDLILEHNPTWRGAGGNGFHGEYAADLTGAGFGGLESFSFDVDVPYTHEAWRGRVRASAGVAASLAPEQVAAFDAELAELLRARFPADPLAAPHRVWALVGRLGTGPS